MFTKNTWRALILLAAGILTCHLASGQNYVKLVQEEDLISGEAYCDSLLTRISFPHAVSSLPNYPKANIAAIELMQMLQEPDIELLEVYVCGSTSPAGLWGDNVKLSQARTNNVANYLQYALDIPEEKIHKSSIVEDWDRLYDMIAVSNIPYKYEALEIIRTKDWGERKTALRKVGNGRLWKILETEFFPELRSVRFGIFCRVKPSAIMPKIETIIIRDTVYIKETLIEEPQPEPVASTPEVVETAPVASEPVVAEVSMTDSKTAKRNPWHFGIKTNLVSDAMAVPSFGIEFQMGRHISLNIMGKYSPFNIFVKNDNTANVYGISPQLRYWFSNNIMAKGAFVAIDGGATWYTLQWKDGLLYQNGKEGEYSSDAGNKAPAWKVGVSAGYSLGLGKKKAWGIEFETGVGYIHYNQNVGRFNEVSQKWEISDFQSKQHFGFTHACINLTYRFSTK